MKHIKDFGTFHNWMILIISVLFCGCSNDEPDMSSSSQVTSNLQELINKLPMDWGATIQQTKDAMEALNLSGFEQVAAPSSSIMYENEESSMYIVYGFEKSKLYSVLIVFPRDENIDYNKLLNKYLYLGCVTEDVYADPENNRLISIHPSRIYTSHTWSAIGFTMIDDE